MRTILHNTTDLTDNRKGLRNNSTSAEAVLWRSIKNKQLDGRRFRRQFSVGNYILDFYCPEEKLGVELDGADHFTAEGLYYDEKREKFLNRKGIRVIRIENKHVFKIHEQVLEYIKENFNK
jgi:very-short-patch-repair endonuclease